MNHPMIISSNGQARYNEMVQTAVNYRQAKKQRGNPSRRSFLAQFLGLSLTNASKVESDQVSIPLVRTS